MDERCEDECEVGGETTKRDAAFVSSSMTLVDAEPVGQSRPKEVGALPIPLIELEGGMGVALGRPMKGVLEPRVETPSFELLMVTASPIAKELRSSKSLRARARKKRVLPGTPEASSSMFQLLLAAVASVAVFMALERGVVLSLFLVSSSNVAGLVQRETGVEMERRDSARRWLAS